MVDLTALSHKSFCGRVRSLKMVIEPALKELAEAGVGNLVRLQTAAPAANARKKDMTRGYFHKTLTKEELDKLKALDSMDEEGAVFAV